MLLPIPVMKGLARVKIGSFKFLKSVYFKNVYLTKPFDPKNCRNCPVNQIAGRGIFCNFLGQMVLSSIFLTKTNFRLIGKELSNNHFILKYLNYLKGYPILSPFLEHFT